MRKRKSHVAVFAPLRPYSPIRFLRLVERRRPVPQKYKAQPEANLNRLSYANISPFNLCSRRACSARLCRLFKTEPKEQSLGKGEPFLRIRSAGSGGN